MTKSTKASFTPPYNVTWRTITNSWDKMASESLPAVIDRSYLRRMPGSAQTSYLTLVRQFGLVDEKGAPTDLLHQLVYEPESRPQIINRLLREHYAPIVELGKEHTTAQQLVELWKDSFGQEGHTRRKAITFFMQAATFAGIPVSSLWQEHIAAASRQASKTSNTRRGTHRIPKQKARHEPSATPTDTVYFADDAGSLSISVDVDLFKLSTEDREFVFKIVDAVRAHQSARSDADETEEVPEVSYIDDAESQP